MIEPILLKTKYEDVLLEDNFSNTLDILKCLEKIIGIEDINTFLTKLPIDVQHEIIKNTGILSNILDKSLSSNTLEDIDLPEPVSTTEQLIKYFNDTFFDINKELKIMLFGNPVDPEYPPPGELVEANLDSDVFENIPLTTKVSTCQQIQDYTDNQVNKLGILISNLT